MLTLPVIGRFVPGAEERQLSAKHRDRVDLPAEDPGYPALKAIGFDPKVVNVDPLSGSSPLTADIMQKEP